MFESNRVYDKNGLTADDSLFVNIFEKPNSKSIKKIPNRQPKR